MWGAVVLVGLLYAFVHGSGPIKECISGFDSKCVYYVIISKTVAQSHAPTDGFALLPKLCSQSTQVSGTVVSGRPFDPKNEIELRRAADAFPNNYEVTIGPGMWIIYGEISSINGFNGVVSTFVSQAKEPFMRTFNASGGPRCLVYNVTSRMVTLTQTKSLCELLKSHQQTFIPCEADVSASMKRMLVKTATQAPPAPTWPTTAMAALGGLLAVELVILGGAVGFYLMVQKKIIVLPPANAANNPPAAAAAENGTPAPAAPATGGAPV